MVAIAQNESLAVAVLKQLFQYELSCEVDQYLYYTLLNVLCAFLVICSETSPLGLVVKTVLRVADVLYFSPQR